VEGRLRRLRYGHDGLLPSHVADRDGFARQEAGRIAILQEFQSLPGKRLSGHGGHEDVDPGYPTAEGGEEGGHARNRRQQSDPRKPAETDQHGC